MNRIILGYSSRVVLRAHGPRVRIDDFMLLRGDWFLICSAFVTTGDRRLGRASTFPVADTNFTSVLCARFKVVQPDSPPADPSRYISSAAVVDPAASTYLSPSYSTPPPPWGPDTLPYSDRIPTWTRRRTATAIGPPSLPLCLVSGLLGSLVCPSNG